MLGKASLLPSLFKRSLTQPCNPATYMRTPQQSQSVHTRDLHLSMSRSEDAIARAEDQLEFGSGSGSGRPRGGKAGRGGRGGGKAGGGRGGQPRDVVVSKALSKLLRHDAVEAGLGLDAEGFAVVEDVVSWFRSFSFFSSFLPRILLSCLVFDSRESVSTRCLLREKLQILRLKKSRSHTCHVVVFSL